MTSGEMMQLGVAGAALSVLAYALRLMFAYLVRRDERKHDDEKKN